MNALIKLSLVHKEQGALRWVLTKVKKKIKRERKEGKKKKITLLICLSLEHLQQGLHSRS